jgi:hypothetical protein
MCLFSRISCIHFFLSGHPKSSTNTDEPRTVIRNCTTWYKPGVIKVLWTCCGGSKHLLDSPSVSAHKLLANNLNVFSNTDKLIVNYLGCNFLVTLHIIEWDWKMITNVRKGAAVEYLKALFENSCRLTEDGRFKYVSTRLIMSSVARVAATI